MSSIQTHKTRGQEAGEEVQEGGRPRGREAAAATLHCPGLSSPWGCCPESWPAAQEFLTLWGCGLQARG